MFSTHISASSDWTRVLKKPFWFLENSINVNIFIGHSELFGNSSNFITHIIVLIWLAIYFTIRIFVYMRALYFIIRFGTSKERRMQKICVYVYFQYTGCFKKSVFIWNSMYNIRLNHHFSHSPSFSSMLCTLEAKGWTKPSFREVIHSVHFSFLLFWQMFLHFLWKSSQIKMIS